MTIKTNQAMILAALQTQEIMKSNVNSKWLSVFAVCILSGCFLFKNGKSGGVDSIRYSISESFKAYDTITINFTNYSRIRTQFPIYYLYDVSFFDSIEQKGLRSSLVDTILNENNTIFIINQGIKHKIMSISDRIYLKQVRLEYPETLFGTTLVPIKDTLALNEEIRFTVISNWDNDTEENTYCRDVWFDTDLYPIRSLTCYTNGHIIELMRIHD